jgi:hypothetical protein
MIDDSLSDTQQQEKKQMSMNELNFYWSMFDKALVVCKEEDKIKLLIRHGVDGEKEFKLNNNQAHLLMLYLQEHLGYVSISKDRLND